MIRVTIPGPPVAQGRPRFARVGRFVRAYDPAKSRNWKATAQEHMRLAVQGERLAAGVACIGAVHVEIDAIFSCPRSRWSKRTPRPAEPHTKRPDAENVAKAVLDAGTGVLWLDDSQVAELVIRKVTGAQGEAPRVDVRVQAL